MTSISTYYSRLKIEKKKMGCHSSEQREWGEDQNILWTG